MVYFLSFVRCRRHFSLLDGGWEVRLGLIFLLGTEHPVGMADDVRRFHSLHFCHSCGPMAGASVANKKNQLRSDLHNNSDGILDHFPVRSGR